MVVGPNVGNVGSILNKTGNPIFNPYDIDSIVLAIKKAKELLSVNKGEENKMYAQYVIEMSLATKDAELNRYALRLQSLIDQEQPTPVVETVESYPIENEELIQSGATEEEIYKAQVAHHYIGALR